jgi:hypothetical protein
MRIVTLPLPQLGFMIATRAALGAGVALLLSRRLPAAQRRAIGLVLVGLGVLTTVPAALWASSGLRRSGSTVDTDPRLIGAGRFPRKGNDEFV